MDVGLGTGSTAAWAVAEIGRLLNEDELSNVRGVATSLQSHELAKEAGIPLIGLDEVTILDVAIDGADQYSEQEPTVVKGGGAAHSREKVVDTAAEQFVIVTDEDRATDPLDFPVPVEVLRTRVRSSRSGCVNRAAYLTFGWRGTLQMDH